jgi:hypothetical protein
MFLAARYTDSCIEYLFPDVCSVLLNAQRFCIQMEPPVERPLILLVPLPKNGKEDVLSLSGKT